MQVDRVDSIELLALELRGLSDDQLLAGIVQGGI